MTLREALFIDWFMDWYWQRRKEAEEQIAFFSRDGYARARYVIGSRDATEEIIAERKAYLAELEELRMQHGSN